MCPRPELRKLTNQPSQAGQAIIISRTASTSLSVARAPVSTPLLARGWIITRLAQSVCPTARIPPSIVWSSTAGSFTGAASTSSPPRLMRSTTISRGRMTTMLSLRRSCKSLGWKLPRCASYSLESCEYVTATLNTNIQPQKFGYGIRKSMLVVFPFFVVQWPSIPKSAGGSPLHLSPRVLGSASSILSQSRSANILLADPGIRRILRRSNGWM